ncbi:flagellar hook protein FlgE [Chitinasiproducens palmae]|uniref:Flagellar hook protein FlgE n=1 Tax=Chitinasiproducens palmae TaxID=1770053 RepID=A0A1H2PJT2_9BURK|nr:flagellar hook protein FlgE [Chitinasiproducens palmae]SDV46606.1 flagellar hook protein FlgE [Chitinasiproducens palmae]
MGYSQGLSGLSAASSDLDVIGNNISNANTVGYKQSGTQFAAVYANALATASGNGAGIGTSVAKVAQSFTQGTIATTGSTLDLAINGNGFFTLSNNGTTVYSRNGEFSLNSAGQIVNAQGMQLTGYNADANGNISTAAPAPLSIPSGAMQAAVSTSLAAQVNLPSDATAVVTTGTGAVTFDPSNTASYTNSTSTTVYDSLGSAHTLGLYFVKTNNTAGDTVWQTYTTIDGTASGTEPAATLSFDTSGKVTGTTTGTVTFSPTDGAAANQSIALDFSQVTQYGTAFATTSLTTDGYSAGQLSSFAIDKTGTLTGTYSNGKTATLGQIALSNFANPEGLVNLGNNVFAQSATSGIPVAGTAGTGSLGSLQSGATESSNVDLTSSLVDLITAQRFYQANAQTIKTQQAVDQTLMNL